MRLRTAALVLLSMTACVSLLISRSRLEGWHGVEVGDVRIVAEASADELDALASNLAAFDAAFAHLIGGRIESALPSTTIYLVREPRLARRFGLGSGAIGRAWQTLEGSFAWVLLGKSPIETRLTLFHEYTHLLLARNRQTPLPRWYNEGLAEYFSTLGQRDGALVVGSASSGRLPWLAARGPMTLDRLFTGSTQEMEREEILDFYATAWALVHYQMGTPDGRRELSRFTTELARGVPVDEARQSAFGRPLDRLAEELSAHIGYLARGVPAEVVLDPSRIAIVEPQRARPLAPGEVARELGSLALTLADRFGGSRQQGLARALLEIAADEHPTDARARAALAYARALTGDANDAETAITQALRDAPDNLRVQLDAGRVRLAGGSVEEAEAHFRSALSLDERSAAAWFGLGRSLARAGHADEALEALQSARRVGWSDLLDLEIGRLLLAADRSQEALELLWPLAQDPHGGETGEEAAEVLRKAGLLPEAGDDAP